MSDVVTITLSGSSFPPTVSTSSTPVITEAGANYVIYNLNDQTGNGYQLVAAGGWYSNPAPGQNSSSPLQVQHNGNWITFPTLVPPNAPSAGTMLAHGHSDRRGAIWHHGSGRRAPNGCGLLHRLPTHRRRSPHISIHGSG